MNAKILALCLTSVMAAAFAGCSSSSSSGSGTGTPAGGDAGPANSGAGPTSDASAASDSAAASDTSTGGGSSTVYGSCTVTLAKTSTCREYTGSKYAAGSATTGCPAAQWSSAACPRSGSVGSCVTDAGAATENTQFFYGYSAAEVASLKTNCTNGGGAWHEP